MRLIYTITLTTWSDKEQEDLRSSLPEAIACLADFSGGFVDDPKSVVIREFDEETYGIRNLEDPRKIWTFTFPKE